MASMKQARLSPRRAMAWRETPRRHAACRVRPIFTLRIVRPRISEPKLWNHCAKKLDGTLRKPTSFVWEFVWLKFHNYRFLVWKLAVAWRGIISGVALPWSTCRDTLRRTMRDVETASPCDLVLRASVDSYGSRFKNTTNGQDQGFQIDRPLPGWCSLS